MAPRSLRAAKNDAGLRLDSFLLKALPKLPEALLYKYIRTKRIKLNGKRCNISDRLKEGDLISLYIRDELLERKQEPDEWKRAPLDLDIIYEDENLLVLNKRPGLLCHPDGREFTNTLVSSLKRYLYEKGEWLPERELSFVPALVNRLDRNTGGIVLAAKNAEALRLCAEKLRRHEIERYYLCVVHGKPSLSSAELRAFLLKDTDKNKVFVCDSPVPGSKEISLSYKLLRSEKELSLLEVRLISGRSHQIRAQLASEGLPVYGDLKYAAHETSGSRAKPSKSQGGGQLLYAYKIRFAFKTPAGALEYLKDREFCAKEPPFLEAFPDY